ncbi:MAG: pyruvoyl-dependent arginine decarboxylase [Promethearchaeota archaeon]
MSDTKLIPRKAFLTSGVGRSKYKLVAFENALKDARIERYNLVPVSSILPPGCIEVSVDEGNSELEAGQIVHCVMSMNESNEKGKHISASVGIAKPNKNVHGYIAEYHANNEGTDLSNERVQEMAAIMLASSMGIPFDDSLPSAKLKQYLLDSGQITEIKSTISSIVVDDGWCCVLSAVVFVC